MFHNNLPLNDYEQCENTNGTTSYCCKTKFLKLKILKNYESNNVDLQPNPELLAITGLLQHQNSVSAVAACCLFGELFIKRSS